MARKDLEVVISARNDLSRVMSKIGVDMHSFRAGINAAAKGAAVLAGAVAAVGGALAAIAITTAKAGDEFQKMSLRTGVSVEALSEFKYAAELSGASIDDVETGFRKLSKAMLDADNGLSTAVRTFDSLGLSTKDSYGQLKAADVVFMEAVDALNSLSSATEQSALAQELFGKSGTKLLPLIKEGKTGIAALREEAKKLGVTFTDVEANQAAAFSDELDRVKSAIGGLKNAIGKDLLPAFTRMLEQITNWITTSQGLHTSIEKTTRLFKNLAETLGFDVLSPLEKVNKEISAMQAESAALAFRIFGPKVGWSEKLNELLKERMRLLTLESQAEAQAKRDKVIIDVTGQEAPGFRADPKQGPFDAQLEAFRQYQAQKQTEMDAAFQRELELEDMLLDRHLTTSEAMRRIDEERLITASKVASGTVDFANNMYTILGQKSRAFAAVAKGAAITQAIIDGKTAAVAAWAAGMKAQPQGWWSPAIAAAFTVASLARTGALIASIGGSQAGGGGGIGGAGTVRTTPEGSGFNSEFPAPGAEKITPTQQINITIHTVTGEVDGRAEETIMRLINSAGDRSLKINANVIAVGA